MQKNSYKEYCKENCHGAKVSVIMPVYNVEGYLKRAVQSVISQSFHNFELIIVDDGSTDNSGEICDELANTDDRIRVIHKENGGLSSARNEGLDVAEGEYIYFMDSDDWIEPGLLMDAVCGMENDEGADLVYFKATREDEKGSHLYDIEVVTDDYSFSNEEQRLEYIVGKLVNYKNGWEVCFRLFKKSLIDASGLRFQNEREVFAEDYLFTFCYIMLCKRIKGIDKIYYHYTLRDNSLMQDKKTQKNSAKSRIQRLDEFGRRLKEWVGKCECNIVGENVYFIYYLIYEWHFREFSRTEGGNEADSLNELMNDMEFHRNSIMEYKANYVKLLRSYGSISGYTTVIVPVYNIEKYLNKCVESIVNQTCGRLQIILVDDGSTDGSGRLCDEWAKKDYRITVVHKENGGLSSARNAGLDLCLGQYVIFIDADDYVDRTLVLTATMALEKNEADICTYRAKQVTPKGEEPFGNHYEYGRVDLSEDEKKYRFLYESFLIYKVGWEAWKSVFRSCIIKNNNLRFVNEREVFAEDLLFTTMYLLYSDSIMCITDFLYYYVYRSDSLMNEKKERIMIIEFNTIAYYIYNEIVKCRLNYCETHFYRLYERIMFWHVAYLMWKTDVSDLAEQTDIIRKSGLCMQCMRKLKDNESESLKLYGREELLRNYCYIDYVLDNDDKKYTRNWKKFLMERKRNIFKNKVKYKISRLIGK